ncbi:hypothetical protein BDN71DRAFT_1565991 [Pleurotus eryngii]|uniref:CxC2-like cysteine cluster KDZ transposase-associated domain-containing protein n=1 Tax=Pleurotus eryngii TaxID=5323 RepID=A0A9P5ZVN6_PLEER|nr:hypothetical protein BDN71DRAFT_1565991 [Pleurotus eryngii]
MPLPPPEQPTAVHGHDDSAGATADPPAEFVHQISMDDVPQKRLAGDIPLLTWLQERNTYVQELLCLKAPTHSLTCACCQEEHEDHCGQHHKGLPSDSDSDLYQCVQCSDDHLFCQSCIVAHHMASPFHQVEHYNTSFFKHCMLQSLELQLQLGHLFGEQCIKLSTAYADTFIVITSHGLMPVSIDFCDCAKAVAHDVQLLRSQLFPATVLTSRTAATFEVLRLFQMMSFNSKVSGYEFYQSLVRLTNNLGEPVLVSHYNKGWLKILTFHHRTGISGASDSKCAVLCPACPHPGKNLPPDWEQADKLKRWIYALFLAINANFRLKRLSASNDARDPNLNQGSAYFVKEARYKDFLCQNCCNNSEETSTCNNYDAVKSASIRGGKGTTASGVGMIECSRHDMKRPVSVGDLQQGEQYVNMDYLYFSSIKNHSPSTLVISYDIACQWLRNLQWRLASYPSSLASSKSQELSVQYLVPKFHLYAHRTHCQINYSFNLMPGWVAMNPIASSTKEMGLGSQQDTLDDHFSDYNWCKIISLHTLLYIKSYNTMLKKVQEAMDMQSEHIGHFLALSESLLLATVATFAMLIQAWEADPSKDNLYEAKIEALSAAKVRLQLAQEDAAATTTGTSLINETITPSVMISQGLNLEEHQVHLKVEIKALPASPTKTQMTQITDRCTHLMCCIVAWQTTQEVLIPAVALYRWHVSTAGTATSPKDIDLMLPSGLLPDIHIDTSFYDYEWCLRCGQLLIVSLMYQSKDHLVRSQQPNTWSATLINNIQVRIKFVSGRYCSDPKRVS